MSLLSKLLLSLFPKVFLATARPRTAATVQLWLDQSLGCAGQGAEAASSRDRSHTQGLPAVCCASCRGCSTPATSARQATGD